MTDDKVLSTRTEIIVKSEPFHYVKINVDFSASKAKAKYYKFSFLSCIDYPSAWKIKEKRLQNS